MFILRKINHWYWRIALIGVALSFFWAVKNNWQLGKKN
jgi:hypothetical protein